MSAPQSTQEKPAEQAARGPRDQRVRWLIGAVAAVAVVLAVVALLGWQWSRTQQGVLTGVHVDGQDVGGQSLDQLEDTVQARVEARNERPVVIEGDREQVEATRAEAGAHLDADTAVDRAWRRGRRGVFASFVDHVRARVGAGMHVEIPETLEGDRLTAFAEDAADELSVPPRDAAVRLRADEGLGVDERVEVIEPADGEVVDAEDLGDRLGAALEATEGGVRIDAPGERTEPSIVEADVEGVLDDARTAVSAPLFLRNPGAGPDLSLSPARIADVLRVEADPDAPEGTRLRLTANPDALRDEAEVMSSEPTEARFVVQGEEVHIEGGEPGVRVTAEKLADQVRAVAVREDPREERVAAEIVEPERTREEAEQLGIREPVSSFTTEHACCEPRVHNIQLMADMIEGVVLEPGERFSINDHVGRRTRAKGFRADGVIVDGEVVDQVGGGVSQYATTFFNAAFFAGIELVEHQPHSFYISRYPAGREATLAYNLIDVVIENNSPYGILVTHSYTGTSITVTFYSTEWAQVQARHSERRNIRPGEVQDGFDITVERIITYPDGETAVERYFTRYEPNDEGA